MDEVESLSSQAKRWINYEGEGLHSWFMNKATRLGRGGTAGAIERMASAAGVSSFAQTTGGIARDIPWGVAKTAMRGAVSTVLPTEPYSKQQMKYLQKVGGFGRGAGKPLSKGAQTVGKSLLGGLSKHAFKWIGPVFTGIRLKEEINISQQGFAGAAWKSTRIVGEESMWTVGAVVGGIAGQIIGGPVGAAAGIAAGIALGWAGKEVLNVALDVAEVPFRMADAGWKYFREAGKRSAKLELGGGVSAANRTGMAYTMRQRALSQMNRSGINARSLLGQEASYVHMRG